MKFKKSLYCVTVIIAVILLSTLTVHATSSYRSTLWSDSGSTFARNLITHSVTGIKLPCVSTDTASDLQLIMTFLHQMESSYSPLIMSVAPAENNIGGNISRGKVASVPEPFTLLILGTGLIGFALYRRLKNK
jgi:hypothetical protein